ncbi:MAG: RNA polymerase sigma factor [Bacteroidota bacterium]
MKETITNNPSRIESGFLSDETVREYGPLVTSICRRLIQDPEIAKDAAQEVWIQIIKSRPAFKGESKLSTWIYTIAYRVAKDYSIRERTYSIRFLREYFHRDGEPNYPGQSQDPEKAYWVKEMCDRCLTGILHCLEPEARVIHVFKEIAGLTYQEIAEVIGKDEATVRQIVSRAKRKLANFMNDECMLYNPNGKCRCRMKGHITESGLADEYRKIKDVVNRVSLFQRFEKTLPKKDYWESII